MCPELKSGNATDAPGLSHRRMCKSYKQHYVFPRSCFDKLEVNILTFQKYSRVYNHNDTPFGSELIIYTTVVIAN